MVLSVTIPPVLMVPVPVMYCGSNDVIKSVSSVPLLSVMCP